MIDLHAHVLPALDDGPSDLAESLQLLRWMAQQGVRQVVAGPHALDGRYNTTRDQVLQATEQVNRALEQERLPIRVLPGMELFLGFDLLRELRTGQMMGLNDSSHLLVELPAREFPQYTERACFELMIAGYRPILNHPERNSGIHRNPDRLYRLAEKGVLAMVTAASLTGRFGPEVRALAAEFVTEGAATLVVSDAHDLRGRAPLLPEGLCAAAALGKVDQAAEVAILT